MIYVVVELPLETNNMKASTAVILLIVAIVGSIFLVEHELESDKSKQDNMPACMEASRAYRLLNNLNEKVVFEGVGVSVVNGIPDPKQVQENDLKVIIFAVNEETKSWSEISVDSSGIACFIHSGILANDSLTFSTI